MFYCRLQPGLTKDDDINEAGKSLGEEKGPDIIPGNLRFFLFLS